MSEPKCPECGSTNVSGLMQSFWVCLGKDEYPLGEWNDWSTETELGEERMCRDCEHEW
jgi:ribosomal protein L37AE/L43A